MNYRRSAASVLLMLGLVQCRSAAIQRQETNTEALSSGDERRQTAIIARKEGFVGQDAMAAFEKQASLADDEVEPDCKAGAICSYNDVVRCRVTPTHHEPSDIQALVTLIKSAAAARQRIRPIGARHTANPAICPDGEAPLTVSLAGLPKEYTLDTAAGTVRVGAGMGMGELMEELLADGYSLGTAVPFFRGVTVGGAVATAAHGSSWTQSSVISSNVVGLTMIDGRGEQVDLTAAVHPDVWLAARASLGAFGIVTAVTFKVVPTRQARLTTGIARDARLVAKAQTSDALDSLLGDETFGQVMWFPNTQRYLWTRVVADDSKANSGSGTKGGAPEYENATLSPHVTRTGLRLARRFLNGMTVGGGNCWLENFGLNRFARGVVREVDDTTTARRWRRGRGPLSRMITSEVLPEQAKIPQLDFEFAFPAERAGEVLALAESTFDAKNLCLPLIGVFLRFSREPAAPTTLIGHSAIRSPTHGDAPARVMFFEFVVYAPRIEIDRRTQSSYLKKYDEFAVKLIELGGWPHWAKNSQDLLALHATRDRVYAERLARFRRVADCLDPNGVFSSDFAEAVGLRSQPAERSATACPALGMTP